MRLIIFQGLNSTLSSNLSESWILYKPRPSHHNNEIVCKATNTHIGGDNSKQDTIKIKVHCKSLDDDDDDDDIDCLQGH